MKLFETEADAMAYVESIRWTNGSTCPGCNLVESSELSHKTAPNWCKPCRMYFSVKTGTLTENSYIKYRKWTIAIYLLPTSLEGVSSYKLANDIGMHQSNACFMAHGVRISWTNNASQLFGCEVEVHETYFGGKEKNEHYDKMLSAGRDVVGKTAVVGIKERGSKKIKTFKVGDTKAITLHKIVCDSVSTDSTVYTDDAAAYHGLEAHGNTHKSVEHPVGEYVKDQAHINGTESFLSCLKRGYYAVFTRRVQSICRSTSTNSVPGRMFGCWIRWFRPRVQFAGCLEND